MAEQASCLNFPVFLQLIQKQVLRGLLFPTENVSRFILFRLESYIASWECGTTAYAGFALRRYCRVACFSPAVLLTGLFTRRVHKLMQMDGDRKVKLCF